MYLTQNPEIAYRVLDGDAIIVDPSSSMAYSLNSMATLIWEMSAEKTALADIIDRIEAEYEVERAVAEEDCLKFVRDFLDKGILLAVEERSKG